MERYKIDYFNACQYGRAVGFVADNGDRATVHTCDAAPFVGGYDHNGRTLDSQTLRTLRRLARKRFDRRALWSI